MEKKKTSRSSTELKPNCQGEISVEEMFFIRIGRFSFRQRWIDREISPSLTGAAVVGIAAAGFVAGLVTSRVVDMWAMLLVGP